MKKYRSVYLCRGCLTCQAHSPRAISFYHDNLTLFGELALFSIWSRKTLLPMCPSTGLEKSVYPIIHPATNAFRMCFLPPCLCSPKSTGKYPRTLEGPNTLIHITGLFTANFSSMIPPVSPRYLMFDFLLNFTAGVRTFPILLTECPESPWTITHHFCYQNMKTSTNLLLNPITLAYLGTRWLGTSRCPRQKRRQNG